MYLILVSFYFTLYLSCAVVLVLRARQWRQHNINPDCRKWLRYPFFGMLASFLYALWDLYPGTMFLPFLAGTLHRYASSISSAILLVLLIQHYGDFRINQSRFRLLSLLLLGLSIVIILITPVQIFLSSMHEEPLPDIEPFPRPGDIAFRPNIGWQSELPRGFNQKSMMKLVPEMPPKEFERVLQQLDHRMTFEQVSRAQETERVEYAKPRVGQETNSALLDGGTTPTRPIDDDLPWAAGDDLPGALNLILHTLLEFIRWGSLVIKVLLLIIAIVLKIKDYARSDSARPDSGVPELANWLVFGSALVLLQEPWLVQTCLGNTIRAAHTTRRIHAIVDPALFALLHECFAGIGYWHEEEEMDGSSNLRSVLDIRRALEGGFSNVFRL